MLGGTKMAEKKNVDKDPFAEFYNGNPILPKEEPRKKKSTTQLKEKKAWDSLIDDVKAYVVACEKNEKKEIGEASAKVKESVRKYKASRIPAAK